MKNLEFNYKETALIAQDNILEKAGELKSYIEHLQDVADVNNYESEEAFIYTPFDMQAQKEIKRIAEHKNTPDLKYIIVVGIGGSNLGTKASYEALYGNFDQLKKRSPKIIFADTDAPSLHASIKSILDEIKKEEELLINLVTKSGTNTEPIVNFEGIYSYLVKRFPNINQRIIVTTQNITELYKQANKKGITTLDHPKVGGRYSVFTAVGLLPLFLAGVNTDKLLKGAQVMRDKCLSLDIEQNIAAVSAILIYLQSKNGKKINNNFFFNSELESVGKWYRQLMGESIGKEKDTRGNMINAGITPIISLGSTDLHSMAQLYFGGPRDKFTNFVYANDSSIANIPKDLVFPGLVKGIEGKDFKDIMDAIYLGTKNDYKNKKLPFMEVLLPEISEKYIGQYLQFKMMEMMFLAKLLGVNAFDQPSVEGYKEETRRLLEN